MGQRQLFERYRDIAGFVSTYSDPPICNIFSDSTTDGEWTSYIESFNNRWAGTALTKSWHISRVKGKKMLTDKRLRHLSAEKNDLLDSLTVKSQHEPRSIPIQAANITLTYDDLSILRNGKWVNDEIINSFAASLNSRNRDYFRSYIPEIGSYDYVTHACSSLGKLFEMTRPRCYMFKPFFFLV